MIKLKTSGSFKRSRKFLNKLDELTNYAFLDKYGRQGVAALQSATPVDTGKTASSWYYEIVRYSDGRGGETVKLNFNNSNVEYSSSGRSFPIAIILQYGHGTRNGGYVQGRDYINPAIQPVFDNIVRHAWEEIKKA